jgi:lysophospholipase L1-like esterase
MRVTGRLRRTAARLSAKMPVNILAIGSSSTEGVGASSPAFAYPARLEAALEDRFPGVDVRVVNAGKAGETAERTLARLDKELESHNPDLVLWQVGTNDALTASVSELDFKEAVERGISSIERHRSDVVIVDQQFIRKVKDPARYERFVGILERVAQEERLCLFPRYRLMKFWASVEPGGVESMLASDGFHMNDAGYACVADTLAEEIREVVTAPEK